MHLQITQIIRCLIKKYSLKAVFIKKEFMIENWNDLKRVILYGYGTVGMGCINKIHQDFDVDFVIEKNPNKQGFLNDGTPVLSLEEGLEKRSNQKIIVMTGERVYQEIAKELTSKGLVEYEEFCSIEEFITNWYWLQKQQNCIMELHMALTMKCTLKCKNCNMFVPYYKMPVYYEINQIKSELDLLFSMVDCVFCLTFLGGEPLLYSELNELLTYINNKYNKNIGSIKIVSNGTITPPKNLLKVCQAMPVWFSISDYTDTVPYRDKLELTIQKLKEYGIPYVHNKDMMWSSFGFPNSELSISKEKAPAHMNNCSPICHGYNDGRVYFCHMSWSAEKSGNYRLCEDDYIDLQKVAYEDRRKIALHCYIRTNQKRYISFCQNCGGLGKDNKMFVTAGEQY